MTELSRCHPSPSSPPMGTGLHRRAWRAHMGWPLASWQSAGSKGMWVESYCCCRAFNRADGGLPHVPSFTSGWRHMAKKKKKINRVFSPQNLVTSLEAPSLYLPDFSTAAAATANQGKGQGTKWRTLVPCVTSNPELPGRIPDMSRKENCCRVWSPNTFSGLL